jgi:putative membrane protein
VIYAGLVFSGLAALLHVYIFVMESLTWTSPRTRATFGTTPETAETTKELAFNQGFYNLFLAIVTAVGLVIDGFGHYSVALALIFAGTGSMLAAAVVLLASSPDKARGHHAGNPPVDRDSAPCNRGRDVASLPEALKPDNYTQAQIHEANSMLAAALGTTNLVANGSGHNVMLYQPKFVADNIIDIVDRVRG